MAVQERSDADADSAIESTRANDAELKVGDHLDLHLTGDLAKEYAHRTGSPIPADPRARLQIQVSAVIAQELDDGRLRIEHTSRMLREGEDIRRVTLTAIVGRQEIAEIITPGGTALYDSPGAELKSRTDKETRGSRIELSDPDDVKLQTWKLVEETGG